jgi:hypothetical protein
MPVKAAYLAAGYAPGNSATLANVPSRMVRLAPVKARIAEQRAIYAKEHSVTVTTLLAELDYVRNEALEDRVWPAAVKAIELKARLLGFMVERTEDVTQRKPSLIPTKATEMSEAEWLRMVNQPIAPGPPTNGKAPH